MKKLLLTMTIAGLILSSCGEDDSPSIVPIAGTISGGPFSFVVDGTPDMVSGITVDDTSVGSESTWVITDDSNNILGLPPTIDALEGVDFDGAGVGVCLIWYVRYDGDLTGLEAGASTDDITGSFALSNSITVTRSALNAGTISGGPFTFTVDGTADMVTGITLDDSEATGNNSTWLITTDDGEILGMPPSLEAVEGVNFDGAGEGICLIWYMRYGDDLTGLAVGANTSDLDATKYGLSNSIMVTRNALNGGVISGGPFSFVVDGTADNVSGVSLDATNAIGDNGTFMITDDAGAILGLPADLTGLEGVNFDGAGVGTCFIYYVRYGDALANLEAGVNKDDLTAGTFALSNSIMVTRNALNAGSISGGPFTFVVDNTPDMVSGVMLDDTQAMGKNGTFMITDDAGAILGLPADLTGLEGVNFDGAGVGTCFIYYVRYGDALANLEAGVNKDDLTAGTFALSNSIMVTRNALNAGSISGGPFTFTVDGNPDMVSGITLDNSQAMGKNSTYMITDDSGVILGLPGTMTDLEGVDFDGAGTGTCLIYYVRYGDALLNLEAGINKDDLTSGTFALSNSISVTRN